MDTPVLVLIFNRPDFTKHLLITIEKIKPTRLYIVADGPRIDRPDDIRLCTDTRNIFDNLAWECNVHKLYREQNLGCKESIIQGINWFFSHESEGIILEDDCIPDISFFQFCSELLERYRDDQRIMMISGDNFLGHYPIDSSYYFSRMIHIWGWATWKRAWQHYDQTMKLWPKMKERKIIEHMFHLKKSHELCSDLFDSTYAGEINTWDFQWVYSCWLNNGLSIMPSSNLVTNIGTTDPGGSHPDVNGSNKDLITSGMMEFPLIHPPFVIPDYEADVRIFKRNYLKKSTMRNILSKIIPR